MGDRWTLQDAKNKFSALVEAARNGVPQHVTRRGIDTVVVVSAEEYVRLTGLEKKPARSFTDHLLDAPKLPEGFENLFDDRDQYPSIPRELDLG